MIGMLSFGGCFSLSKGVLLKMTLFQEHPPAKIRCMHLGDVTGKPVGIKKK